MTRYEELCQALAKVQPHWTKLDEICTALPMKMHQAISNDLGVPPGANPFLTGLHQYPVGYVHFAREGLDKHGRKKWGAIGDPGALELGDDRILRFGIGIAIQNPETPYPVMFYLRFSLEEVSQEAVKLAIEGRPGFLTVNPGIAAGFANAAAATTDWLRELLSDSQSSLGNHPSIGFGRLE